jgi:hypothetical protein
MSMTHDEMIAVITAHKEGKAIECQLKGFSRWLPMLNKWDFSAFNYRIKPEPIEMWVNVYPSGAHHRYGSESDARQHAREGAYRVAVHLREVTGE